MWIGKQVGDKVIIQNVQIDGTEITLNGWATDGAVKYKSTNPKYLKIVNGVICMKSQEEIDQLILNDTNVPTDEEIEYLNQIKIADEIQIANEKIKLEKFKAELVELQYQYCLWSDFITGRETQQPLSYDEINNNKIKLENDKNYDALNTFSNRLLFFETNFQRLYIQMNLVGWWLDDLLLKWKNSNWIAKEVNGYVQVKQSDIPLTEEWITENVSTLVYKGVPTKYMKIVNGVCLEKDDNERNIIDLPEIDRVYVNGQWQPLSDEEINNRKMLEEQEKQLKQQELENERILAQLQRQQAKENNLLLCILDNSYIDFLTNRWTNTLRQYGLIQPDQTITVENTESKKNMEYLLMLRQININEYDFCADEFKRLKDTIESMGYNLAECIYHDLSAYNLPLSS